MLIGLQQLITKKWALCCWQRGSAKEYILAAEKNYNS